jgi:hypothetical protein
MLKKKASLKLGTADAAGLRPIQHGENEVDHQIDQQQRYEELGPVQRHRQMVWVTEVEARDAGFGDLEGADPYRHGLVPVWRIWCVHSHLTGKLH